jgi:hypothetical protein
MSLATSFIESVLKNPKEKAELLKIFSDYFDNPDNEEELVNSIMSFLNKYFSNIENEKILIKVLSKYNKKTDIINLLFQKDLKRDKEIAYLKSEIENLKKK